MGITSSRAITPRTMRDVTHAPNRKSCRQRAGPRLIAGGGRRLVKRSPDAGGQILVPRHLEEAIGVERHGQHQRSPALAPVGHVPISLLEGTETSLSGER